MFNFISTILQIEERMQKYAKENTKDDYIKFLEEQCKSMSKQYTELYNEYMQITEETKGNKLTDIDKEILRYILDKDKANIDFVKNEFDNKPSHRASFSKLLKIEYIIFEDNPVHLRDVLNFNYSRSPIGWYRINLDKEYLFISELEI